jgi:hypothetical protein
MNPEGLRRVLDAWANANPKPSISTLPSECACEGASSPPRSVGQVHDEENLAYFVTSTYSIDLTRKKRDIPPKSLKNVFDKGLSTVRVNRCDDDEIKYAAQMVTKYWKEKEPFFGGLVSIILVSCSSIRHNSTQRLFCVYETPCDPAPDGGFHRPSHADILSAEIVEGDEKVARLGVLYNRLVLQGDLQSVFKFAGGMLSENAPQALIEEHCR